MPSAGDLVRASDIMHRIVETTRGTNLGAAVTTDTVLACDAIFTLSRTRRVRVECMVGISLTTPAVGSAGFINLRRNTTGAAIATSDTSIATGFVTGGGGWLTTVYDELLAAGTYAYGPTLSGSGSTVNTSSTTGLPMRITVWDMGDS